MTRLVTVSHGTRLRAGNLVGPAVTARAARLLHVPGTAAYVELCGPSLGEALSGWGSPEPTVVVPLLLSTGLHQREDIPGVVRDVGVPAVVTPGLGPDPLIAEVLVRRLCGAGARATDPVVLVAAGSRDPDALVDLERAGRLLSARWRAPVRVAVVTGNGPTIAEALKQARREAGPNVRIAVSPYLLARGHFATRVRFLARQHGAQVVADVIGADPLVSQVVVRRFRQAVAAATAAA